VHELDLRLRKNLEQKEDFNRIHPMPQSGQDVPSRRAAGCAGSRSPLQQRARLPRRDCR
jgi:hypothetical protein